MNRFYIFFSIWCAIMVIIGFWPGYFSKIVAGEIHFIIHIHAIVFTGWILLFFYQAYTVFKRRINTHKKWGKIGIYYGFLILLTGLITSLLMGNFHEVQGRIDAAFFSRAAGIRDIIVFGLLFYIAIRHRNFAQKHRIWMFGAVSYLIVPAVARANGFLFEGNQISFYVLWLLPVFLGLLIEKSKRNPYKLHYFIILIIMVISSESLGVLRAIFLN